MRGIPGSGKTTAARALAGKEGIIHSTDEYFEIKSGLKAGARVKQIDFYNMNQD